jgi:hypothetical protein
MTGWILSDGVNTASLVADVPPGGVIGVTVATTIATTELAYLFDATGVRRDQVGLHGQPPRNCSVGRCPDGAGPSDGYDYATSGGGGTWIPMTCTIGQSNATAPECHPAAVGSGDTVRSGNGAAPGQWMGVPRPNPAKDAVLVEVRIPAVKRIRIEVLAASGRRVATLADGPIAPGAPPIEWDAGAVPSGVYFLRMTADGRTEIRTVVVAR